MVNQQIDGIKNGTEKELKNNLNHILVINMLVNMKYNYNMQAHEYAKLLVAELQLAILEEKYEPLEYYNQTYGK